jgi:hypothetical protein
LNPHEKRFYDRVKAAARKFRRFASDCAFDNQHDEAQQWRDAAAELKNLAAEIAHGIRPTSEMPTVRLIAKIDDFNFDCAVDEWNKRQREIDPGA